ncbi:MAG: O-antigen ligase family protein [Candidatus Omnitrophica bacterium]|nr:O-antigen ligase family protein [Candidatus Omnitrophota bacterium]MBU1924645.1 O-antigen ligase family protein [Candidatus Omnitrophota bacterium]
MNTFLVALISIKPFLNEAIWPQIANIFNIIFLICAFLSICFLRKRQISLSAFIWALGLPILIFFSQNHSINVYNSRQQALTFFTYGILALVIIGEDRKFSQKLVYLITILSLFIGLRALYQEFIGLPYIMSNYAREEITKNGFYAWELIKQKRVVSWFLSPNILAGYIIMVLPLNFFCLVSALKSKNRIRAIGFIFTLLINFFALAFTRSMGAYLALVFSLACWWGVFLAGDKNKLKKSVFAAGGILLILVLVSIFMQRANCFVNFNNPQNSVMQRMYYWRSAARVIKESPLSGVGAGNFGIIYPRFKEPAANETVFSHNSFLQLWAECGVFALIFFIGMMVFYFSQIKKKNFDLLIMGSLIGVLAFLIHNLFDYTFFIPQVAWLWWVLVACSLRLGENEDLKDCFLDRKFGLLPRGIMAMLIVGLIYFNFLNFNEAKNINKAEKFLKNRDFEQAIYSIKRALDYRPNNDFSYYLLARALRGHEEAEFCSLVVDNYKKAIKLNPQYAFYYYELGEYFMRYGKFGEAQCFLKYAVEAYPTNKLFLIALDKVNFVFAEEE